jgi:chemotaxis protein methyltransferase CheR
MIENHIYKYFADIIYKKTGIFYPEKDYYRLDSRLNALINNFGLKSAEELYNFYRQNMTVAMETLLIDLSTNNETYFFRDNKPFDALVNNIIPNILAQNPSQMIQIWSCASSTGQEPLSILMAIKEKFPHLKDHQINLMASDISTKALDKAKKGNYTNLEVQRGLPITLLMKYFDNQEDNTWTVHSDLLNRIKYESFNLLTGLYPINKFDVIFCRNVLIYQDKDNKDKIMHKLYDALKPGGHLLMGAGESMIGTTVDFAQESLSSMMVFKKSNGMLKAA